MCFSEFVRSAVVWRGGAGAEEGRAAVRIEALLGRGRDEEQIQFNGFLPNEFVNLVGRNQHQLREEVVEEGNTQQYQHWRRQQWHTSLNHSDEAAAAPEEEEQEPTRRLDNENGEQRTTVNDMNTVSTGGGGGGGGGSMGKKGCQDEELVATSPGQRNWRGIFIALLVIAAVLGLIVFSIFLLSPTDEGNRLKGQRLTLTDVTGDALKPRPVNASWISDVEIVYRDTSGGLSILNLDNFTISTLMTNSTFRQLNAVKFSVSPDVKYVLLLSDILPADNNADDDDSNRNSHNDSGGGGGGGGTGVSDDEHQTTTLARYHVFEVQARNQFPLSHKDSGVQLAPHLQLVLWAPNSQSIIDRHVQRQNHYRDQQQLPPITTRSINSKRSSASTSSAGQQHVNSNNYGAVPALHSQSPQPMSQLQQMTNGSTISSSSISGGSEGVTASAGKPWGPSLLSGVGGADGAGPGNVNNHQAIAFVHENDIYYKPKVQQDLVCRITSTGRRGVIYNGIPDWFYANVVELRGPTLAFSPDALFLSFLSFNDSNVNEYRYTVVGDSLLKQRYPEVKSIRYPKANTPNPNVTVFVVHLSNPKFVFPQPIRLPDRIHWDNDSYVGAMVWASKTELSITVTNREQTNATTVLCSAPQFQCRIVYVEQSIENTTVLPSDMPVFAQLNDGSNGRDSSSISSSSSGSEQLLNKSPESSSNGVNSSGGNSNNRQSRKPQRKGEELLLKRIPVRDGEFGFFRHIAVITAANARAIPITMGRHEVVEVLGWDERQEQEKVYFLGTLEDKPGQRHLFEVPLRFNYTEKSARLYVEPTTTKCLTCDNSPATYSLLNQNFTNNFTNRRPSQNLTDTIPMKAQQPTSAPGQLPATTSTSSSSTATTTMKTGKVFLKPHEPLYTQNKLNFLDSLIKLKLNRDEDEDDRKNLIRNNCLFNRVHFSPAFSYYMLECLGPERPTTFIVNTKTNKKIFVLDSNDQLTDALSDLALPQVRKMSVELKEGSVAQVRLFLPPGLKDEEEVAFPLILQMDTGPGSQLVDERFLIDWNWFLAGSQQMIVAQIDGRGSGFQGELLKGKTVGRLGGPEIEDQLAILTYLRDTFSYIDRRKICAYGWGYGGYAAAMTLLMDKESDKVLQCAVAINPITSFSLYNSFFTERYIPTGEEFIRSLQESDLTTRAGQLDERNLFIIHGTADKLVHQQHAMTFARELVNRDIVFRQQIYADEGHRLSGVLSHLYKSIEDFFQDAFGPADRDDWDPAGFFAFKQ